MDPRTSKKTELSTSTSLAETEEPPTVFQILEGDVKTSDYAKSCFLVPESQISDLLDALKEAENSQRVWSIVDEKITDIQSIPSACAFPIRTIDEIPKDKKSESELLDWLIHGDDMFSKEYVILEFVDGKYPHGGNSGREAYEITKKEHMRFYDVVDKLLDNSYPEGPEGELTYLAGVEAVDRGEFLREFGKGNCKVVDDEVLEKFEELARGEDPYYPYA